MGANNNVSSKFHLVISWKPSSDYRKPQLYSTKSDSISCCFPVIAVVFNLYLNKPKDNCIQFIVI